MSFSDAINAPRIQVTSVPTPEVNPNNVDRNEEEVGRNLKQEADNKKQLAERLLKIAGLALKLNSSLFEISINAAMFASRDAEQAHSVLVFHQETEMRRRMASFVKSVHSSYDHSSDVASVLRKVMSMESVIKCAEGIQPISSHIFEDSSSARQSAQHAMESCSTARRSTQLAMKTHSNVELMNSTCFQSEEPVMAPLARSLQS